jgi:hypothetical protein
MFWLGTGRETGRGVSVLVFHSKQVTKSEVAKMAVRTYHVRCQMGRFTVIAGPPYLHPMRYAELPTPHDHVSSTGTYASSVTHA